MHPALGAPGRRHGMVASIECSNDFRSKHPPPCWTALQRAGGGAIPGFGGVRSTAGGW